MNKVIKRIITWSIAIITILLIMAIIVLMIGGMFAHADYLDPWDKRYYKIFKEPRLQILSIGVLAPSAHNLQNWQFKLDEQDDKKFYVFANPERIAYIDPTHREMLISIGAFLEYMTIAAKKLGFGTELQLFPQGPLDEENIKTSFSQTPIAQVTLNNAPDLEGIELYDNLFIQDTNRYVYVKTPLSQAEMDYFFDLDDFESLDIKFFSEPAQTQNIKELGLKGLEIVDKTPRLAKELKSLTRLSELQKNKKSYGLSLETEGVKNPLAKYFMQGILTTMPFLRSGKMRANHTQKMYEKLYTHTPTFMSIVCPTEKMNDRLVQVNCGRLYARLVLSGHILNIGFHPMSSVIADYPEADMVKGEFMTKYLSSNEYPFMLTRVGMITKPFPKSMREYALDHIK